MIYHQFSKEGERSFAGTVKARVNAYFDDNNIDRNANVIMVSKSIFAFGFYCSIYFTIILGDISSIPILFCLWAALGLGQALIGMTTMHDLLHGSYSKKKFINILKEIPVIAVGVESKIWQIEHNFLHHNFTNIEGLDQDIANRFVFRFTANQPRRWFHRYQHLYATFVYGLLIIEWLTIKDFVKIILFRKRDLIKTNWKAVLTMLSVIIKKGIFYFVFLIIPLQTLDFQPYIVVLMFLTMIVLAGVTLTIIFQTAHVTPNCSMHPENMGMTEDNWYVHQMLTTSNFSVGNKRTAYLVGSLNYQIEHHLFPEVCHVHYGDISGIVRETAKEFGLPYYAEKSFWNAISKHYGLLKELGARDGFPKAAVIG